MKRDDIQVETLSLSTNYPGIERRIHYLLAKWRIWREMLSRWKRFR